MTQNEPRTEPRVPCRWELRLDEPHGGNATTALTRMPDMSGLPQVQLHAAGCDGCGMSPLLGTRYRKLPATEDYDLCERCHADLTVVT